MDYKIVLDWSGGCFFTVGHGGELTDAEVDQAIEYAGRHAAGNNMVVKAWIWALDGENTRVVKSLFVPFWKLAALVTEARGKKGAAK